MGQPQDNIIPHSSYIIIIVRHCQVPILLISLRENVTRLQGEIIDSCVAQVEDKGPK